MEKLDNLKTETLTKVNIILRKKKSDYNKKFRRLYIPKMENMIVLKNLVM